MLYDVDFESGKVRWARELHKGYPPLLRHIKNSYASETPVVNDKRVVAVFGNVGVFCLDHDGKLIWSKTLEPRATQMSWGPAASPALAQERLWRRLYLQTRAERENAILRFRDHDFRSESTIPQSKAC